MTNNRELSIVTPLQDYRLFQQSKVCESAVPKNYQTLRARCEERPRQRKSQRGRSIVSKKFNEEKNLKTTIVFHVFDNRKNNRDLSIVFDSCL